jgi:hypothetical protein
MYTRVSKCKNNKIKFLKTLRAKTRVANGMFPEYGGKREESAGENRSQVVICRRFR